MSEQQVNPPPDESRQARKGSALRLALKLLAVGLLVAVLGTGGVVGLFAYYGRELPSFEKLEDYHPPETTRVYDRDGAQVAEFAHERRTVVPKERIPTLLKQAVISAEDASFYQHKGLDYVGIARAALKDLTQLRMAQGASTITQQVVKNMVLSPERSMARKVKEAILARRLEQNLSKEDILHLYLNHIYFGHSRYGIEEAAQHFFGKPVDRLGLGEIALLAGLPQSPERLSPIKHPDRAKARQAYVLKQMVENGFITKAQADQEASRPVPLALRSFEAVGPYYAEEVRRQLVERYGEAMVYEGGMRIDLGMDRALQAIADQQLEVGIEELDHKIGFKALETSVDLQALDAVRAKLLEKMKAAGSRDPSHPTAAIWDFSKATGTKAGSDQLLSALDVRELRKGAHAVVPVSTVSEDAATFDLGTRRGVVGFEQLKWARPYSPGKWTQPPKRASDVLAAGQLVRIRVLEVPAAPASVPAGTSGQAGKAVDDPPVPVALASVPQVQGALVVVDPQTRHVVAMAGGYDFSASPFNRATQAHRQPGSCFKPILYGAALASGRFTPASIVNDAPDLFRDPWTGKEWRPKNFEDNEFEGPMILRRALARSKNTVAVRLIDAIGAQAVIDLARKAGINSQLTESLTLALGTGEVSPLELANAYATFAALGKRAEPLLIVRVTDRSGKVLEEHHAVPEETIPPAVAYVLTSMLRSVIEYDDGTGHAASQLKRPIAGKTGTASDGRDAWFAAYTPDLVAAVWTGFDDHSSMGQSMTGGRAALPIWMGFMREALEKRPRIDFPMPPGVEVVAIDPKTGLRAPDGAPGRQEFFVEGTVPKDFAPKPGEADKNLLFLEDGGGKRP
ncbi:MAG: PBP1A family penicillin-binding protein [Deltaproteobacteria bacterium]|nr:PBP1A family penicillin-binding protein [Deltaproteobacteria bacterium]